ncbi:MAG: hypothetical protein ACREIA_20830, partial [Opitutaceae bacterium]
LQRAAACAVVDVDNKERTIYPMQRLAPEGFFEASREKGLRGLLQSRPRDSAHVGFPEPASGWPHELQTPFPS